MNEITLGLGRIDWYNPVNREKASSIANDIDLEVNELLKVATNVDLSAVYIYHKKKLGILKSRLTKLINKDNEEWFQDRIAPYR